MNDALDFQLDIEQRLRGGEALTQLEKIEAAYGEAKIASQNFAREGLKTAQALDKTVAALSETRSALEAASKAGDEKGIAKYTAKLGELEKQEIKLRTSMKATETEHKKADATLQGLASSLGKMKDAEKRDEHGAARTEAYTKQLVKMTGKVGEGAEKLSTMGSELGTTGTLAALGAAGIAALAAAVVAASVALIAGAAALLKYAVGLTDVRKNQEQTLRALTQSNEKAAQLGDSFENIAKGTGVTEARLGELTDQLTESRREMGLAQLSGNQLERALYALSEQETAIGSSAHTQYFIDQINTGTKSVERLGSEMDAKFGDVLQHKMLGLGKQTETLGKNVEGIFSHVDTTGLERGFSRFVALFDRSTASGKAIETMFETIFGPATGDLADRFFIGIERWVLKTELTVLKLGIHFKSAWKRIDDALSSIQLGPLGSLKDALASLEGPAGNVATWFLAMLTPATALHATLGLLTDAFGLIGKGLKEAWNTGKEWVGRLVDFGTQIVDGIHDKIVGGADKIASAIRKLLKGSVDAAKDALDAHSPSRLFAREVGEPIGEGTAMGVEKSTDAVADAVDAMLKTPSAPMSGGSSSSVSVSGNEYHFHGIKGTEDAKESFFESLTESLEGLANQMGTEAPS